jgi:IS5 family transposase
MTQRDHAAERRPQVTWFCRKPAHLALNVFAITLKSRSDPSTASQQPP